MNFLIYGKSPQTINVNATTEIEFLAKQTMTFATGTRGSAGTLVTLTPADLKTFVLLGAGIAVVNGAQSNSGRYTVELRNEANVRDILGAWSVYDTSFDTAHNLSGRNTSVVRGDILIGDGIKTYTLEATVTNTTLVGTIYGYLIDT